MSSVAQRLTRQYLATTRIVIESETEDKLFLVYSSIYNKIKGEEMMIKDNETDLLHSIWIQEEQRKTREKYEKKQSEPFRFVKRHGNTMCTSNIQLWNEFLKSKCAPFEKHGKHKPLFDELVYSWNSEMKTNQLSITEKVSVTESVVQMRSKVQL